MSKTKTLTEIVEGMTDEERALVAVLADAIVRVHHYSKPESIRESGPVRAKQDTAVCNALANQSLATVYQFEKSPPRRMNTTSRLWLAAASSLEAGDPTP